MFYVLCLYTVICPLVVIRFFFYHGIVICHQSLEREQSKVKVRTQTNVIMIKHKTTTVRQK